MKLEDLQQGTIIATKIFSPTEVSDFARLTHDTNPFHQGEDKIVMGAHIAAYIEQQIDMQMPESKDESKVVEVKVISNLKPGIRSALIHLSGQKYSLFNLETQTDIARIERKPIEFSKLKRGSNPKFIASYSLRLEELIELNRLVGSPETTRLTHACAVAFTPPTIVYWQNAAIKRQEGFIGLIRSRQLREVDPANFEVRTYSPKKKNPTTVNGNFLYTLPTEIYTKGKLACLVELLVSAIKPIPVEAFEYEGKREVS
ncbi:hypothetical protein AUJ84_04675 [Candidatus Pacearchaeota archaeon CG1_02_32_132]|nr:MAG: hypothetical protein AUJ84_04675 [Candidatus Pacearchaeota archaeon CG1_02_32_132]